MLVGISGKMGSGKNLVCTIIQGLTAAKKHNIENPSFEWIKKYYINSIWEQKAFADKLKDMVCLLIGCTREQLEDREFKEKELGEEWWYTYGRIGNVDILVSYLDMDKEFKNNNNAYIEKLTPRELLQIIGTECIRDKVHPNAWVNALFADYKSCSLPDETTFIDDEGFIRKNSSQWIITDMRFPNELEAVKRRGGITIRVNRPGLAESNHESETSLDSAIFDYIINNDSSIEDLIHTVSLILKKEKII